MQTFAEIALIKNVKECIESSLNDKPLMLNLGAGKSMVVENELQDKNFKCVADRIDIDDCKVNHPLAGKAHIGSIESMPQLKKDTYSAIYANFVFEHISDINNAASEIFRILTTSGRLIVSLPNPAAPEFLLNKIVPLCFRRIIVGRRAWKTYYAYDNITNFQKIFEKAGLKTIKTYYYPAVYSYLNEYPIVNKTAELYDQFLLKHKAQKFMGHACIVFEKQI